MRSRSVLLVATVAASLAGPAAQAQAPAQRQPPPGSQPPGGQANTGQANTGQANTGQANTGQANQGPVVGTTADTETSQIRAKVTRIDHRNRTLTLRGPAGNEVSVLAGPEVRDFDRIKRGDDVIVRYTMSTAIMISKPGTKLPDVSMSDARVQAPPGGLPAGAVGRQVAVTGLIVGVDPATHVLSVVDQHGGPVRSLLVRSPERQAEMRGLRVGEMITVVFTEAVAVAVQPAAAR